MIAGTAPSPWAASLPQPADPRCCLSRSVRYLSHTRVHGHHSFGSPVVVGQQPVQLPAGGCPAQVHPRPAAPAAARRSSSAVTSSSPSVSALARIRPLWSIDAAARREPDAAFDPGLAGGDHGYRVGDSTAPHRELLRFLGGFERLPSRHHRGVEAAGDDAGALQRVAAVQLGEAPVVADADAERPGRAGMQREAQVAGCEVPLLQDGELSWLVRFDLAGDVRLAVPAGDPRRPRRARPSCCRSRPAAARRAGPR